MVRDTRSGPLVCAPLPCEHLRVWRLNAVRLAFALDLESTHLPRNLLAGVHILGATM
jgi:hypothetical protein